jgi:hypothetical protein
MLGRARRWALEASLKSPAFGCLRFRSGLGRFCTRGWSKSSKSEESLRSARTTVPGRTGEMMIPPRPEPSFSVDWVGPLDAECPGPHVMRSASETMIPSGPHT